MGWWTCGRATGRAPVVGLTRPTASVMIISAGEDVTLLTTDFRALEEAIQAITRALDERRSLILARALQP
jgi:hypothetical protein